MPADSARPAPRLARSVATALLVKLILLAGLYWLFFSPSHRPVKDPDSTATAVLGQRMEEETIHD